MKRLLTWVIAAVLGGAVVTASPVAAETGNLKGPFIHFVLKGRRGRRSLRSPVNAAARQRRRLTPKPQNPVAIAGMAR